MVSNAAVLWLRSVAADSPLLILVVDLHWVDRAGAEVLGFVARRLVGSPIVFLGACRTAERGFFAGGGLTEMALPPLPQLPHEPRWTARSRSWEDVPGELVVGSGFVVVMARRTFDGIVGELVRPYRFGWAAISDGLSFYQTWLRRDEPDGGTLTVFQEASRGPSALLLAADRLERTRSWADNLLATDGH